MDTIVWLIERTDRSPGPQWFVDDGLGWHDWTSDASSARPFISRAQAENFPPYRMIASDPAIRITEHVFIATPDEVAASKSEAA